MPASVEPPFDAAGDRGTTAAAGSERLPGEPSPGDKTAFRLAAYGAVLVVVLFAGYGLGRLKNGTASAPPTAAAAGAGTGDVGNGSVAAGGSMPGMAMGESAPHTHRADGTVGQATAAMPAGSAVGGLALSSAGLILVPLKTTFLAGRKQRLTFQITGAGGVPVTTFALVHDKRLHLIVIRRDLSGYQHLHPTMAPDGTWSVDLTLPAPGMYRMIADFTAIAGGRPVADALGNDLTVAGSYQPIPLAAPVRATQDGGYAVGYEGTPGTESIQPILLTVTGADGQPATLERYLGAYGHLVMIREGDLGYVHIHPEPDLVDGKVKFWLTAPSRGTYRMFFDFQVAGQVHHAAWTVVVG